jgi:hypothetical protein
VSMAGHSANSGGKVGATVPLPLPIWGTRTIDAKSRDFIVLQNQ